MPQPVLRERRSRSASAQPSPDEEDNPFAAPPEGRPDQPWRPRVPGHFGGAGTQSDSTGAGGGPEDDEGRERSGGDGDGGDGVRGNQGDGGGPSWGSQWSSRQPGRDGGGFGSGPGGPAGGQRPDTGGNGPGGPGGLRWDPTDPLQRRARYALLSGMWAFFFALFSIPEVALLLAALAIYWGISSLRGKPVRERKTGGASAADVGTSGGPGERVEADRTSAGRTPAGGTEAGRTQAGPPYGASANPNHRPQTTAAVSGLVTGGLALAIVAATFTFKIVYHDYYACVDDALTTTSRQSCQDLLPTQLRPLLGEQP